MKKHYMMMVFILLGCIFTAKAQFKMSAGDVDLGLRIGTIFPKTEKFNQYEKFKASTPAIGLTFETGFWNFGLSVGGEFNYATYKNEAKTGDMTVLQGMLFAKYYPSFLTISKLAPYARVDFLPIGVFSINTPMQNESGAKSIYGIYAGGNFQFAEKFGVFAEIGNGYTVFNTGINWRIADN